MKRLEALVWRELGGDGLAVLQALIRAELGVRLTATQLGHCLERAWPALATLGIADLRGLVAALSGPFAPWEQLTPFLTVKETYFLRESLQLADFAETFLPALRERAERRGARRLHVLSAGCATGEEAYTLAVLLADARPDVAVLGVDVDRRALETAERAEYREHAFRGVPDAWRAQHFERTANGMWRVAAAHRARVRFAPANLLRLESAGWPRFDAIFCRNVLIYFEPTVQDVVLRALGRCLQPDGLLFLGHSEMLGRNRLGLVRVTGSRSTAYQRKEVS